MAGFTFVRAALVALGLAAAGSASAQVVISQAYPGGTLSGATFNQRYVEIFNRGTAPVDLAGHTIQYASPTGTGNFAVHATLSGTVPAGGYFLVAYPVSGTSAALPVTPDGTASGSPGGTNGKLALVNSTSLLACNGSSTPCSPEQTALIVDLVGYGTANFFEGSAAAPAFSATLAGFRANGGCTDTNDNGADFTSLTPLPRNSSSPINLCTAPSTPLVSFDAAAVSALEGAAGQSNPLNFIVNIAPAPAEGAPVSFDITVQGEAGRFNYAGPATLTITNETSLPVTITVNTVGNDEIQADSNVNVNLSNFSGTAAQQPTTLSKQGTIIEDDLAIREVFEIQGSGVCSPFVSVCNIGQNVSGDSVRTTVNIVTSVGSSGFTMQTPDARDDNDPATSNGIYVFTAGAPRTDSGDLLAVGDAVEISGRAAEFFGLTQIVVNSTRDVFNTIARSATAQALPTAIVFGEESGIPSRDPANLSCGALGNFECFEGMRVAMPAGLVSASNQRFGSPAGQLFAEVYVSAYDDRGLREPGVRFGTTPLPSSATAAGVWDGNPEIIEMDADFLIPALLDTELVGGTRFSAEGVIGFDFGDYEFWPTSLTIDANTNVLPQPVPASAISELTIGSFNAFRLCDAVADDPAFVCSANATLEIDPLRVAHEVGQISAYIREVLRSPDVVGLQEVENIDVLSQLAARIAADGGPSYAAYLVEGFDVGGIDVAYLVNPTRVSNVVVTQREADTMWPDPNAGGEMRRVHDRPPLHLIGDFIGGAEPFRFQVVNNHTLARTGVDTNNANGNRRRAKRFFQGVSIANLIQELQTHEATANVPLIVVGDHNAYQFSDGYVDVVGLVTGTYVNAANFCAPAPQGSPPTPATDCQLPNGQNIVAPSLINAVDLLDRNDQYSYNFTEQFGAIQGSSARDVATNQVLDHAMFNVAAQRFVTGMAFGRANVDASVQRFDSCRYQFYNAVSCGVALPTFSPVGASDHDGLVIYLDTTRSVEIFANGFETID